MDWDTANKYLLDAEEIYSMVGASAIPVLTQVIMPCRRRYDSGERTEELYNEIMGIDL